MLYVVCCMLYAVAWSVTFCGGCLFLGAIYHSELKSLYGIILDVVCRGRLALPCTSTSWLISVLVSLISHKEPC